VCEVLLPRLNTVIEPDSVDDAVARARVLDVFSLEVGAGCYASLYILAE
jgi:hypothetical protein